MIDIETERLIIRNFAPSDFEALSVIGTKYEATESAKYDHGPWPNSLNEYKMIVEEWSKGDDHLAVVLKSNNKLIGFIVSQKNKTLNIILDMSSILIFMVEVTQQRVVRL